MKRFAVWLMVAAASAPLAADEIQDRLTQTREVVKEFATELKGELMAGMQRGPEAAVLVCNAQAPGIAERLSERTGWEVGRTSLKLRNPSNAPDAWELAVLETFEEQKSQGADPKTLEHHEIVEQDGKKYFRDMKAIPTQPQCLACHGESIAEPIAQVLDENYPDDQARGFKVGDIRGAFTIIEPM